MYLDKLPTYFIKGERRKAVYHTVLARELTEAGWQIEGSAQVESAAPQLEYVTIEIDDSEPEAAVEAEEEPEPSIDFDSMTKAELSKFAEDNGVEIKTYMNKSDLVNLCLEIANG
jgi:hypothetical protein